MNHIFKLACVAVLSPLCWMPAAAQSTIILSPGASISEVINQCDGKTGTTTIYLREGVYHLTSPIVITSSQGNENHSLTISSYPGEKAVISGGTVLQTKWKRYCGGIMKSKIQGSEEIDMLFGDGRLLTMARFPNYDSTAVRFHGTSADATSPERVKGWKNPEGGFLHAMHRDDWGDFHYRITGKDNEGNLELEGGHQNNRPMGIHKDNRMVENIFEELDAPGEWYFDKTSKTLYYYPLPGEDPDRMTFEAAQLKNLVSLKGSKDNPVKNVTLSGLAFRHAARTFMEEYEPLLRSDWTIYRGGAIFLEGTEDCHIKGCDITDVGGNGVFFSKFNRRSSVEGCLLTRIGASAVCFVGDPSCVRSPSFRYEKFVPWEDMDFAKGPKGDNFPAECLVKDNLIHEIGLFEKQITGVEISMSFRITVSHNSIYDTPRAGINISEGTWGGHIIEYNDVFNTVKETGDHGSFNSWGRDRYWHPDYKTMVSHAKERPDLILADMLEPNTLRYNRFRCDRGWDIDLDDGSSYYIIHDNLCLNGGIKLREGFYRRVENNIIVNNTLHAHAWFDDSGDVFARNLVMTPYLPYQANNKGNNVDFNIFTDSLSFNKARELGHDAHSIVSNVVFANPKEGIYTLKDDSQAIRLGGFMNIPMDRFGVQSPRLKRMAKEPVMDTLNMPDYAGGDDIWYWKNGKD
ncbi:MAG: right-handed parallel beta-helix repeat-containing protein [Bacteroidales bacterium]|nr:right-handed parallel beta-helix repeat-containing protein [Bacteroidales bacterium]